MIILHENLRDEAFHTAKAVHRCYNIPLKIMNADLSEIFKPIPQFNGYLESVDSLYDMLTVNFPNDAVMVLTGRDLYTGDKSRDDEWIFGYSIGDFQIVSTASMKCEDNSPSDTLEVPLERFLKRFTSMAIHELGHSLVKAEHYKPTSWVNINNGLIQPLGKHCTDNTCVMYEVIDIKTPPRTEGYLLLGDEKRFDAGLDEHIERMRKDWFCDDCRNAITITDKYRAKA
jgi:predicted Zn-dependent protease